MGPINGGAGGGPFDNAVAIVVVGGGRENVTALLLLLERSLLLLLLPCVVCGGTGWNSVCSSNGLYGSPGGSVADNNGDVVVVGFLSFSSFSKLVVVVLPNDDADGCNCNVGDVTNMPGGSS